MVNIKTSFLADIKSMLFTARQKAYAAVNSAMVEVHWNIGKRIFEEEQLGRNVQIMVPF
ncbi:ribosomal protein L1 [Chitinophaga sp. W2I13]